MDKTIFLYLYNFSKNEIIKNVLILIIKLTRYTYMLAFFYMEIWLYIHHRNETLFLISIICLLDLLVITALRKVINAKRPCELLDITPIVSHRVGNSFPSRHTSSIWIISIMVYYLNPALGIFLMAFAFISGIVRIMAGIHFPKDILAGALISIMIGVFCFGFFI